MRLVAGVLSLALFAPFARAEDTTTPATSPPPAPAPTPVPVPTPVPAAPAARVPFRVVRVMPETRQALLFDRSRNTHILAEIGGTLDGYTIEDIDDETVILRRDNQQVVLAAPLHGPGRARELPPVRLRSAAAPGFEAAPLAPAPSGPPAPIDPYGDPPRPAGTAPAAAPPADALPSDPSIRVTHAPGAAAPLATGAALVPGEGGIRVATAPDGGPGPGLPAAASAPGPAAASWGATAGGAGAIRVVSAAPGPGPAVPNGPAAPSAAPVAPGSALAAPSAASVAPGSTLAVPSAAPANLGSDFAAPSAAPAASGSALAGPSAAPANLGAAPAAPGSDFAAPSAAPANLGAAPANLGAAPGAPSAAYAAPGSALAGPSAAPTAPGRALTPSLPSAPGAPAASPFAPGAWKPGAAAPGASAPSSGGPREPDRMSREIDEPSATAPRVVSAAAIEPAADPRPTGGREVRTPDAARAPDRQTADARALADILTADRPSRSPRALAEPAPSRAAEVRTAAAGPAAPGDGIAIPRSELDGALADFARLTAGVRGSFSASGVQIDAVGDGTIFQRAGLRAGDVVTSVDGVRLRTLDDAANLYARASTARAITAQVVRAGKPITLHVVIQ